MQAIKEIVKTKTKDGLDTTEDSQLDTSGVENKENTKEGTNSNSFIAYTPITDGLVPGLSLINDEEREPRTERTDKVNGTTEVSVITKDDDDDDDDDYDPIISAKNVTSNSETVMDTTDSVPNKEGEIVNGEDGFGEFDHLNDGQVAKEEAGDSEMDTTENETELDNTMSPSDPQISSADNATVTDKADSAEDRNLDDRLASLAKASDLLHSIAQAAAEESEHYPTVVDFKEDADDVLENEVCAFYWSRFFFFSFF